MESTRISLARVLELGVPIGWREAAAVVYEALARTGPTKGARPTRVTPAQCQLTRGGEVHLLGEAVRARPETVLGLLEELLPACDSHGGLGVAFESGRAISFLEELSLQVTGKRRRVEIAGVALRALCADADRLRAEAERSRVAPSHLEGPPIVDEPDEPIEIPADLPYDLVPSDQWLHKAEPLAADRGHRPIQRTPIRRTVAPAAEPWAPIRPPVEEETRPRAPIRPPVEAETRPWAPSRPPVEAETRPWAPIRPAVEAETTPWAPSRPAVEDEAGLWAPPAEWDPRPWPRSEPTLQTAAAAAVAVPNEFDQLRAATLRAAANADGVDVTAAFRRLVDRRAIPVVATAAAVAIAGAAGAAWQLGPAPRVQPPPAPAVARSAPIAPLPLPAGWVDEGRTAETAPRRPAPPVVARDTSGVQPTAAESPEAILSRSAPPPPPPAVAATVERLPLTEPAAPVAPAAPAASAVSAGPVAAPNRGAAPPTATEYARADDTLYSWVTPGVEPPVLRYPSMASTALKGPDAVIDGPYFEVLVGADGTVETVRIRGRIEPGETFYRHRMMLAAAKLWRFTPATVNGRPVRYVTRVVLDEP